MMHQARGEKKPSSPGGILLVANFESNVGYAWWLMEFFWVTIAEYFVPRGRQVFLIYPKIAEIPDHIRRAPMTILEHDFSDTSPAGLAELRKIIRAGGITSVYLTDRKYHDSLYLRLRLWGVRRIVLHDHTPGERPPLPVVKQLLKRLIHLLQVFSCSHYIGVSQFVHRRFRERGMIPGRKCSFVMNGIVPIEIRDDLRGYAQAQFNIPDRSVIVASTGRATFYKGIDFIIRCADEIINRRSFDNVYFLHCGDGPDLDAFENMVHEHRLQGRFILAGRRSDISCILPSCQIGLQASLGEAFSLSILEYMCAGLATVAPNNCGNSEAISHGVTGYLFSPGDQGDATSCLVRLIQDSALRAQVGERARESILRQFTIAHMRESFLPVIAANL